MPPKINDFEDLIEKVLDVDKKEIQSIEMKQSAAGIPYWEIKVYSHKDDNELCANIAIKLDYKLRKTFLGEDEEFKPTVEMKDLRHFNKLRDPAVKIELTRSAKGFYSCTVRYPAEPNNEEEMIDKIKSIRDLVLSSMDRTVKVI